MSVWADVKRLQQPLATTPDDVPSSVWGIPEEPLEQSGTKTRNLVNHFGDGPGTAIVPPSPEQENIAHNQQELEKVRWHQANPWGTPENHPGHLGKLAHVFSQIGNIAGNIVAPNVMARIPGTQLGMQEQAAGLENNIDTEQQHEAENEQRHATAGNLESETNTRNAELPYVGPTAEATNRLHNAQANKAEQDVAAGPDLATAYAHAVNDALKNGRDPSQDLVVQRLSDAITGIQKQPASKSLDHVNLMDAKGKPYAATFHPDSGQYTDATGKVIPNPIPYEKPVTVNVGSGEKTFEYSDKALGSIAKPIEDLAMRMGRLKDTLAQGNPQADALVAPELLTVMAGGQGSGLRMNEAEIARVIGGRSQWENLKASVQRWNLDPREARSITPEQDQQIRALIHAVDGKMQHKLGIINEARNKLVDIPDPQQQHRLVAETHRALQEVDTGGAQAPPGASQEVWKNGALIGHVVGNKFVPVEANAH